MMEFPLSLPIEAPRLIAAGAALAAMALLAPQLKRPSRAIAWLAPLTAAALSAGYLTFYLRGGPRIIDATTYWLQGRALADGLLSFPAGEPAQGVWGRFLLPTNLDGMPAASVIFPPGYPALLALGFLVGAPLAIGPLLAAAIVVATMDLMRVVAREHAPALEQQLVTISALLSVFCAALRYHTADTMAHGLAALCLTSGLAAALRISQRSDGRQISAPAAVFGATLGLLLATRPASALPLAIAGTWAMLSGGMRRKPGAALLSAVFAAPPILLWLAHQHAATGDALGSAQYAYYGLSDGPPGCFRYGFGKGIGCLGEHGPFVRHNLRAGFGLPEALMTSARRLHMHLSDGLGFAPLFALVVLAGWRGRHSLTISVLSTAVGLQLLAYLPFYFDGNYPGGGARMLADAIPLEHVLCCLGLLEIGKGRSTRQGLARGAATTVSLGLAGFAFHLGSHHEALRDREGGRPMFEPERKPPAGALLFIDTDHGFNLAYDPSAPTVARWHGDDLDLLRWRALGTPPAYRYHYEWSADGPARSWLSPLRFDDRLRPLRIEGPSLWPVLQQRAGWAWPEPATCASRGRALTLKAPLGSVDITIQLPNIPANLRHLEVALYRSAEAAKSGLLEVQLLHRGQPAASVVPAPLDWSGCRRLPALALPLRGATPWQLRFKGSAEVALDALYFLPGKGQYH